MTNRFRFPGPRACPDNWTKTPSQCYHRKKGWFIAVAIVVCVCFCLNGVNVEGFSSPSLTSASASARPRCFCHNQRMKTLRMVTKLKRLCLEKCPQGKRAQSGRRREYQDGLFFFSASADALSSEDGEFSSKGPLTTAYQRGSYLFAALGVVILLMPDRTTGSLASTKWGGAAGFGLAAGLYRILAGANSKDQLESDTYKRLNLALLGFSLVGLVAIPGEAAFLPSAGLAMVLSILLTVSRAYGVCVAGWGWSQSVVHGGGGSSLHDETVLLRSSSLWYELVRGTRQSLAGLRVTHHKKALTYRNQVLLVLFGLISSFMEGLFNVRYQQALNKTWFDISLQWSAVARLWMIAAIIASLKDAAERDRLTGTTFIALNILSGCWAFLVGLGQSLNPSVGSSGLLMFAFGAPFFLRAYKSVKEKSNDDEEQEPQLESEEPPT